MATALRGGGVTLDARLDRVVEFDEASRGYPIRTLIPDTAQPRSWAWPVKTVLDQGVEGMCVGFSISHELNAPPVQVPISVALAEGMYHLARRFDGLPEHPILPGATMLGGVKAATAMGFYTEYRWAFSEEDLLLAVGHKGPALLGCNWYEGMAEPNSRGFIQATGRLMGGHAICVEGVSLTDDAYVLCNSWGEAWGNRGRCRLPREHLRRLMGENGEMCIPLRRWRPSPV